MYSTCNCSISKKPTDYTNNQHTKNIVVVVIIDSSAESEYSQRRNGQFIVTIATRGFLHRTLAPIYCTLEQRTLVYFDIMNAPDREHC